MTDWITLRDQLNLSIRPIDVWPGSTTPAWKREKGPFTAGLKDTLQVLRKELNALKARAIVLQVAFKPQHMRLDGLPRAGATAEHPGVILAFESSRGPLRIWFDRFTHWHFNLRAIALHLEHLRMATLYGVGEDGQAYRGWTALPPPPSQPAPPQTHASELQDLQEALLVLCSHSSKTYSSEELDEALHSPMAARKLMLEAAKTCHPDNNGDTERFIRVQRAAEIVRKYHNL